MAIQLAIQLPQHIFTEQVSLEVDRIAGRKTPEVRAIHRFGYGVGGPPVVTPLDDGPAAPVHGDRRPHLDVVEHGRRWFRTLRYTSDCARTFACDAHAQPRAIASSRKRSCPALLRPCSTIDALVKGREVGYTKCCTHAGVCTSAIGSWRSKQLALTQ